MSKKITFLLASVVLAGFLLSGCMRDQRTQTIIIPDTEEDREQSQTNGPFEVKTIFRLPGEVWRGGSVLGWYGPDKLLRLAQDSGVSGQTLESLAAPFESGKKLYQLDKKTAIMGLSPDGRYAVSYGTGSDGPFSLKLISIADRSEKVVDKSTSREFLSKWFMWSDNSRYLSYLTSDESMKSVTVNVYDSDSGELRHYAMPGGSKENFNAAVKFSDDGKTALIVNGYSDRSELTIGIWEGDKFSALYQHELAGGTLVAWINSDQAAFIGRDGALYTYDPRNDAVAVLLERADDFQLSPDRKFIAYTKDKDTIYAGKLQGNNILNPKSLYQGVIPWQMAWSPDNGKLLVQGQKSYTILPSEQESKVTEIKPGPVGNDYMPFVIEFK
ncbi:WD40 repeat domain-containing protein [Paenibacillus macerans]|uniref:WD40 repeat domain-containing protein n=1 Tax=Paenibacillus macerans TaxID=44252 RepID=UPI003D31A2B6